MTEAEIRALEYLGGEADPFSSPFEVLMVFELWGGDAEEGEAMLERWRQRGWVHTIAPESAADVPLLTLTEAGYAALARARRAS